MSCASANDWYEIVVGDSLEQGDIFRDCPIYRLEDMRPSAIEDVESAPVIEVFLYDVVVLSQSCDLQVGQGKQKIQHVVLCPIQGRSAVENNKEHVLSKKGMLGKAAKGEHPAFCCLLGSKVMLSRYYAVRLGSYFFSK